MYNMPGGVSASSYREPAVHADYDSPDDDGEDQFHEASSNVDVPRYGSEDSESSSESDDWQDAAELADLLAQASKHKTEGNVNFGAMRDQDALEAYNAGVACLPARKVPKPKKAANGKNDGKTDLSDDEDDVYAIKKPANVSGASSGQANASQIHELQDDTDAKAFIAGSALSKEEAELVELRSTLWSNIAACYMRMTKYKEAVEAATEALADKPNYTKALQRRANANEKLNTWTSLSAALDDYKKLATHSDVPKSALGANRVALRTLPGRIEERKNAETKEMMDKLKGLGNSLLGKFGLSTDNFQFVKNDETGGYSMNFSQAPAK